MKVFWRTRTVVSVLQMPSLRRAVPSSKALSTPTPIHLPILAIMGYPQNKGPNFHSDTPKNIAAAAAADANQARQIDAFERGQPTARVIRIPNANHYIFISNESQVLVEMNKFLDAL